MAQMTEPEGPRSVHEALARQTARLLEAMAAAATEAAGAAPAALASLHLHPTPRFDAGAAGGAVETRIMRATRTAVFVESDLKSEDKALMLTASAVFRVQREQGSRPAGRPGGLGSAGG